MHSNHAISHHLQGAIAPDCERFELLWTAAADRLRFALAPAIQASFFWVLRLKFSSTHTHVRTWKFMSYAMAVKGRAKSTSFGALRHFGPFTRTCQGVEQSHQ